jgi:hypothetical protein
MLAARCLSKLVPPHVHLESPPPSPRVRCVARCSPMHARAACERRYWRLAASDDALPPPPAFASVRLRAGWGAVTRPRASAETTLFASTARCRGPRRARSAPHGPWVTGLSDAAVPSEGAHRRSYAQCGAGKQRNNRIHGSGVPRPSVKPALPRQCGRPEKLT